jgi:hypothetical protein
VSRGIVSAMIRNSSEIKGSRKIALLDVENLAGSPFLTPEQAVQVQSGIQRVYPLNPRDIVYVGGSTVNAFACGVVATMAHGSLCLRRGRDGAEIALCERATQVPQGAYESNLYPITECVIGSGDHYFVTLARQMKSRGIPVTVVSRRGSLSTGLAVVADKVIYMDNSGLEIRKAA